MTIPASSLTAVNALLEGWTWTGTAGTGTTVDYTFRAADERAVDGNLRGAVNTILSSISEFANISFDYKLVSSINNQLQQSRFINNQENHASVPIIFEIDTTLPATTLGLATFPFFDTGPPTESRITAVDVAVNSTTSGLTKGNEGFTTLIHEIGHALGLSHANSAESQSGVSLPSAERTSDATVMNTTFPDYFSGDFTENIRPHGMQIYDVAALQHIYGANRNFHAGNDVYSFNGSVTQSRTLWDAGGNDIVSTAGFSGNAVIDLREGYKNVTQVGSSSSARSNIWFAFGSNIENAQGGVGSDQIFGNGLGNGLSGADGNDTIRGALGDDTVNGNQGADSLFGGGGNDIVNGGKGNDTIDGHTENDTISGNLGDDVITGGDGVDSISGNDGNDILVADGGNDVIRGGAGNDQIYGGSGEDVMFGGTGNDFLNGNSGSDIYVFEAGFGNDTIGGFDGAGAGVLDIIRISATVTANVSAVLALATITDTGVVISFNASNSITILGATAVAADDFVIF